jgi:hypothetical protein
LLRKYLELFVIAAFSLSVFSCNKNYNTGIYRTGRAWDFDIYFFDTQNHLSDSCSLQMAIGNGGWLSYIMDQRELKYTYGKCCGKDLRETTGVDEREHLVFIHPPRLACFSFAEIPPMPEINLPINMTSVSTGELQIVKSEMKGLNGKTIKQKTRLVKMEDFGFADTTIKCVMIEGENTNYLDTLGIYKCEYLFNEYYGFVQLSYHKPNGESVKFVLKSTNFK